MAYLHAQIEYLAHMVTTGMSLYKYFSVKDKLPFPTGPLSLLLSSFAIVAANGEVTNVMDWEKE